MATSDQWAMTNDQWAATIKVSKNLSNPSWEILPTIKLRNRRTALGNSKQWSRGTKNVSLPNTRILLFYNVNLIRTNFFGFIRK